MNTDGGDEEYRKLLIAQVNDPDCDHAGPYLKNGFAEGYGTGGDTASDVEFLLHEHGLRVNDEGYAVPIEESDII